MCSEKDDSLIKEMLKSLCCCNGWSYGVFWRFNLQNSLLLTLQDAYYEEKIGGLISDMLLQVHMLGEGLIGRAAFTKKHQYIFSDNHQQYQNPILSIEEFQAFQDDSEFFSQFSTGIKTIAVIPVEPFGVIQFGSFQKVPETMQFVDQTKVLFHGIINEPGNLETENNGLFASIISGEDSQFPSSKYIYDAAEEEIMQTEATFSPEIYFPKHPVSFDDYTPGIESDELFPESTSLFDYTIDGDVAPCSSSSVSCFGNLISNWNSELSGPGLGSTSLSPFDEFFQETDMRNSFPINDFPHLPLTNATCPSNSVQSSVTNVFSNIENEKYTDLSGIGKLLESFGVNPDCRKSGNWNNNSIPAVDLESREISWPSNKLFSNLGINQRFEDITSSSSSSMAISSLEDHLSSANKRRRIETSLSSNEQMKFPSFSSFDLKNSGNTLSQSVRKVEEQRGKNSKKKAKPGTRPRPKDRQQIHDRLLELRKLIQNGEKMSIDGLLLRTIKQLIFLQSVTEHAQKIKQTQPEKVGLENSNVRDCGVTWACEVGNETMACPLIVEDLNIPGQMSIEIQCEERGSFLEIVDIIRGFGLTILKGIMEAREAKIYGRFTVAAEGNKHVTRHEIFSSLVQLLEFSTSNGVNTREQLGVNVGETLKCSSL